jgi:hypothetical protein
VDEVRALGVTVPIVPGIMPIHNFARIAQFAARDGIEIPRWVALKMEGYMDDTASIRAFGLDVVTKLCERLIAGGAPSIHFYTLNQSALSLESASAPGSPGLTWCQGCTDAGVAHSRTLPQLHLDAPQQVSKLLAALKSPVEPRRLVTKTGKSP